MDEGRSSDADCEETAQDDERKNWLANEIPDGAGCIEIWDRLSDARNDE